MSFKSDIEEDIFDVFFDMDEFAELKKYDGSDVHVVEDDESLMRKYSSEFEALAAGSHMILVPAKELNRQPKANDAVIYDGGLYTVDEVKYEMGVYLIFLNKGRG